MKKVLIIMGVLLFTIMCSKDFEKQLIEVENEINESKVESSLQNKVMNTVIEPEQIKDEETVDNDNIMHHISFHNETTGTLYNVSFYIFKNQHHPNGYIIITKVEEIDDGSEYIIEPLYANNPEEYIKNIHFEGFIFSTPEGNRNLTDVVVQCLFRTAEAMVMATIQSTTQFPDNYDASVILDLLKESAERMEGREVGVKISD